MKEIWKQSSLIPKYEVSNLGNIRNCKTKQEKYKTLNNKGYIEIHYKEQGRKKSKKLHRLVATEFCEKPYGKDCVNHKDANKQNNVASNLEWCTHQENMQHAYDHNLIPPLVGSLNGRALINEELVHRVCQDFADGLSRQEVEEKYNLSRNQAGKIYYRTTWKHITSQYKY